MTDCLQCRHGLGFKSPDGSLNFKQRLCTVHPPQVMVLAGPGGAPIRASDFPVVAAGMRCSLWASTDPPEVDWHIVREAIVDTIDLDGIGSAAALEQSFARAGLLVSHKEDADAKKL